jgi:thiamine biosynthesis lipoprotein
MTLAVDSRSHSREWLFCISGLLLVGALVACSPHADTVQLAGRSMGTTWHVTFVPGENAPGSEAVQAGIEALLEQVNLSMSTYREDSEISRFNRAEPGTWVEVSADFIEVLSAALAVGSASDGAYDVTVGPLVDLWGFGPGKAVTEPPPEAAIQSLRQRLGQDRLRVDIDGRRVMKLGDLALDFSSIAKGYAVDLIADWMVQNNVDRFLVEIGGEMRVAGMSARGDPWRIAIEQPESAGRSVARAISLTDTAVATSGDYRNFFEKDGRRYSHTIDPRTGYPVAHELVSVTVVHPSAMLADAWATALTVLGPEAGMAVARAGGLAVYCITREGRGFRSSHTPAFEPYLAAAPGE